MVDPGRVRILLDRLAEELSHLRALPARDPSSLLEDPDLLAAVKYRFVVAIDRTRLDDLDAFRAEVARRALEGA